MPRTWRVREMAAELIRPHSDKEKEQLSAVPLFGA
jgi:hypothetical protein